MKKLIICLVLAVVGVGMASIVKKRSGVSAELEEEISHLPLEQSGIIPSWLSGTLVRNGPVFVTVNGESNHHWLDGLAMLHAFTFHAGEVHYTNRFIRSDAYKTVFEKGSLNYTQFAADPCRSLFKRFLTLFIPDSEKLHNANVNVAKIADRYVALTEIPLPISFDLQTLETLGVLDYQDKLPHEKCWESAHPHHDLLRKETINYLIDYGRMSKYVLYRISDGSSHREVIAEIPVKEPAYMHSFAVTENHVVFAEFPFVVKPLDLLMKQRAFINHFSWQPQRGTQFIVVNRHTGDLIGRYKTKPFFSFHHANAFEKEGAIILDLVCYDDPSVIHDVGNYFQTEGEKSVPHVRLERFVLSLQTGEVGGEIVLKQSIEFPRINEQFDGHPYRFLYLTDPRDPEIDQGSAKGLYKVDMETKEVLHWQEEGAFPGEPVFIATPGGADEDEGVVLALILEPRHQRSFLLILDGKSFKEVGRARVTHLIPPGLHGQYFPY